jgi:hypothetical protein
MGRPGPPTPSHGDETCAGRIEDTSERRKLLAQSSDRDRPPFPALADSFMNMSDLVVLSPFDVCDRVGHSHVDELADDVRTLDALATGLLAGLTARFATMAT